MRAFKTVYLCVFALIFCAGVKSYVVRPDTKDISHGKSESLASILKFLEECDEKVQCGEQKDIVLMLGEPGSGITTLTLLLTDVELETTQAVKGSDDFVFIDKEKRISRYSTITSKINVPELVIDHSTGTIYYDCPSFSESNDLKYDISFTYTIHKLLKCASAIKLVFTVNYSSVTLRIGDRHNFLELTKQATTLIKNIEKYHNAIGLVVNKVEYSYTNDNGQYIDDKTVIQTIAKFLNETKGELQDRNKKDISDREKEQNSRRIKFIEILLEQKNGNYVRISILRLADQLGSVKNMTVLQDEKEAIKTMINQNLQYVNKEDTDFDYVVSEQTKEHIRKLIDDNQHGLTSESYNIDARIKEFYKQQEQRSTDVAALCDTFDAAYKGFAKVNTTEPKAFIDEVVEVLKTLDASVSTKSLYNGLNQSNAVDFLEKASNWSSSRSPQIEVGLPKTMQYLSESRTWYHFLNDLNDNLSEYDMQDHDNKEIFTPDMVEEMSIDENETKSVNDIGLKPLLDSIDSKLYLDIEHLAVDSVRLRALKSMLHQAINYDIDAKCVNNKLVVTGQNIKLSHAMETVCKKPIKYIEVFALNKLYIDIDIDKTGQSVQISLIAPIWEIVGQRKIVLDGAPGKPLHDERAGNGIGRVKDGQAGKPGNPGGAAGNFLGIGMRFINEQNLQVHVNGGAGGNGQHGGKGSNGNPGDDPPIFDYSTISEEKWTALGFSYEILEKLNSSWKPFIVIFAGMRNKQISYKVDGKKAVRPGDGGDGGKGGFGGEAGNAYVIGFNEKPKMLIFDKKGEDGLPGEGGSGGSATKNGKTIVVTYSTSSFYIFFIPFGSYGSKIGNPTVIDEKAGEEIPAGKNGITGNHTDGIEEASQPNDFLSPLNTINSYKNFVRENLSSHTRKAALQSFLKHLEENEEIRSIYDTMGLVNDLECLEKQYFQLRNKIDFVPYIESLVERIAEYALSHDETIQNQKVLRYLYAATLNKLYSMKNKQNHGSIINLLDYIDVVQEHINKLREADSKILIDEYQNAYHNVLASKIDRAFRYVDKQIVPEIKAIFGELDEYIIRLVDQTRDKEQKIIYTINDALEDKIRLERALILRKVFVPIKLVGSLLGLVNPIVKFVALGVSKVTDMIVDKKTKVNVASVNETDTKLKAVTQELTEEMKSKQLMFLEQLEDIKSSMGDMKHRNKGLKEIAEKIDEFKTVINERIQTNSTLTPIEINLMRHELQTLIMTNRAKALKSGGPVIEFIEDTVRILYQIERILSIAEVSMEVYNQFKRDNERMAAVAEAIQNLQDQLQIWNQHEENIYNMLIPQIQEIENTIRATAYNLPGKTHFELDISKWQIQTMLRDVKMLFRKMSKDFMVQDALLRCIDKIDEGMDVLIDVYDRIDTYFENKKLAALIVTITSAQSRIAATTSDPKMNEALTRLRKIIHTNLILDQYEAIMHALKQHVFPFADAYIGKFKLPDNLKLNDTELLTQTAVEQIDELRKHLKQSRIWIGTYDREIFRNIEFSGSNSSVTRPFYVWKYHSFNEQIVKLLQGEEVTLNADITKGLTQNAVKFNEIGIHFKAKSESIQTELDAELNHFGVSMAMVGNSYYRCGTRFYSNSVDENVVIDYSLKKDANGMPSVSNEVYHKIHDMNYFLSPYAMWSIQLIRLNLSNSEESFERLSQFSAEALDLELIGRGQFLKDNGPTSQQVCNEHLDDYYNYDSVISN